MISDNENHLMHLRNMKYIGFKHQRENKQNSDKNVSYNDWQVIMGDNTFKVAIQMVKRRPILLDKIISRRMKLEA